MLIDPQETARITRDGKKAALMLGAGQVGDNFSRYIALLAQHELERGASAESEAVMRQSQGAYRVLKDLHFLLNAKVSGM